MPFKEKRALGTGLHSIGTFMIENIKRPFVVRPASEILAYSLPSLLLHIFPYRKISSPASSHNAPLDDYY